MNVAELQLAFPSFELAADDTGLSSFTVTAGSTMHDTFAWSDLSGISRVGIVGFFSANTITPGLRCKVFTIRYAGTESITTAAPLPDLPVAGDTFHLSQGLKFVSSDRIPFQSVNAFTPELMDFQLANISGITIQSANSDQDLWLKYTNSGQTLSISEDGITYGTTVAMTGDAANQVVSINQNWIAFDVNYFALPGVDAIDYLMIGEIDGTASPVLWSDSNNEDEVIHSFIGIRNASTADSINLDASIDYRGSGTLSAAYTDGDGYIDLEPGSDLPGKDFWLMLNESTRDIRYVTHRAGSRCYITDTSNFKLLTFDTGVSEPVIGDAITAGVDTGILRAVYLASGSWVGGDAAGFVIITVTDGSFSSPPGVVSQGATPKFTYTDASFSVRGYERLSSWGSGDSVLEYPSFDLLPIEGTLPEIETGQSIIDYPLTYSPWTLGSAGFEKAVTIDLLTPAGVLVLSMRQYSIRNIHGTLGLLDDLILNFAPHYSLDFSKPWNSQYIPLIFR